MSAGLEDDIKGWTAKCKAALVNGIQSKKTMVADGSRSFDLAPSEFEYWVDSSKRGKGNAFRAKSLDI